MSRIDQASALALLTAWQARHDALQKLMTSITAVLGLEVESPLLEAMWSTFDDYTKTLAALLGDHSDWMGWYQSENEMGAKGMAGGYDGNLTPVTTLGDLLSLIGIGRDRAAISKATGEAT
jgi:hypothetical protein